MKILGVDYGKSKIGLAIGDSETKMAEPLKVFSIKYLVLSIKDIVAENEIEKIVVGVPGGRIENEIKEFGEKLKKATSVVLEYFDETLTTQDAQKVLIESGRSRKSRKKKEDAMAASLMLQYYLEVNGG